MQARCRLCRRVKLTGRLVQFPSEVEVEFSDDGFAPPGQIDGGLAEEGRQMGAPRLGEGIRLAERDGLLSKSSDGTPRAPALERHLGGHGNRLGHPPKSAVAQGT